MFKIQRLKIIINTEKGSYGFDHEFNSGLNIIASENNTSGKSSIINSIYYVLGFEQLIEGSGTGSKTLSQALTKQIRIDTNGEELPVLESEIQAELYNGKEVITVRRFAKHEQKRDNLITVYNSGIDEMYSPEVSFTEMYVLMPGAAKNGLGFHKYLEDFLGMNLPDVSMTNGSECKLYLQEIFGALFIEQKHGWGGFLNGVPYLGIAEVKKRIVEYLLGLSTLANEKARKKLKRDEDALLNEWKQNCLAIEQRANIIGIRIDKMPTTPNILDDELTAISLIKDNKPIETYLNEQKKQSKNLVSSEPRINVENRTQLELELSKVREDISKKYVELEGLRRDYQTAKIRLVKTIESLEIIQTDLCNNKEARRLRDLGAEQGIKDFDHLCPTCGQKINDSLLRDSTAMSIDENISHLKNQELLFQYAEQTQRKTLTEIENNIKKTEQEINNLNKLQSVLRGDLVKVKDDFSYSLAYKKVKLDMTIENIEIAIKDINNMINSFYGLSDRWETILCEKKKLGNKNLDAHDSDVLKELGNEFAILLKDFGYRSTQHFESINISEDTFLPTINGFDMKYDSSASDELRNIWAFSLALLKIANKNKGNHPKIIIFDEPKQQSVVDESFKVLCDKLLDMGHEAQIIIGVTAFDNGVRKVINELDDKKYKLINIGNLAFKKLAM